uniref:Uncharacterized protein n=1 Tax=Rhodnius prolixus TaxID=13249 RepID=T1HIC1_RHOPR
MEVNETMQKLKVPQNYAPYLQKMGIYDFFYDIAVTYALHQPEDHVIFLRNYLCSLQDTTTQIKILIIGSPHIDKRTLSLEIAEKLNLLVISFKDIKEENTKIDFFLLFDKVLKKSGNIALTKKKNRDISWKYTKQNYT